MHETNNSSPGSGAVQLCNLVPRTGRKFVAMAFRRTLVALSRNVKPSTGIAGLPVVPNAREVLQTLVNKMLKDIQVRTPSCKPHMTPTQGNSGHPISILLYYTWICFNFRYFSRGVGQSTSGMHPCYATIARTCVMSFSIA